MMFLGSFLSDETSLDPTTVVTGETTSIEIENGIFDEVWVDGNTSISPTTVVPDWDYTTVLDAKFNNNILAGNVDFTLAMVSDLVLKKRRVGDYQWTTIASIPITTEEDFNFFFNDIVVASQTKYQYAAVPIINGTEGTYQIIEVDVSFDGAFLIDSEKTYQIVLDLKKENLTRDTHSNIIEPVNSIYPFVNYYSANNYDRFSLSGCFIELNRETCQWETEHGWKYRKEIRDWANNKHAKIVKLYNGEMYMASVVDSISESKDGHDEHIITTMNFVECGDVNSKEDLYYHGFTDFLEGDV